MATKRAVTPVTPVTKAARPKVTRTTRKSLPGDQRVHDSHKLHVVREIEPNDPTTPMRVVARTLSTEPTLLTTPTATAARSKKSPVAPKRGTTPTDDAVLPEPTEPILDPTPILGSARKKAKAVPTEPIVPATPNGVPARSELSDALLVIYADAVDDFEKVRIGTANRIEALGRVKNIDPDAPEMVRLRGTLEGLKALEAGTIKELERAMKAHPLGPWVDRTVGLGYKQAGRLLAAIGDPYWNDLHERPRLVSELWSYAGFSVKEGRAVRREKGVKANWSNTAKMRAFVIASQTIRYTGEPDKNGDSGTRSPYREVYDQRRAVTETRVHDTQCQNRSRYSPNGCGTREHPEWGAPGSAWRDGHRHADALRVVAKEVLRDLWLEAKLLSGDQS